MTGRAGIALALAVAAIPARADVVVLGNTDTGAVVIRGNFPDGSEDRHAVKDAKAQRETGWTQLFADDEKGWGAVVCVRHKSGVFFAQANGQKSEGAAIGAANALAQRFIDQQPGGGIKVPLCAPRWNNTGQQIIFGGEGVMAWRDSQPTDGVIDTVKGLIRNSVALDFQKHCVPPRAPMSAKAELKPIGRGAAPIRDKRPPAKVAPAWKPDPRCPTIKPASSGVRG